MCEEGWRFVVVDISAVFLRRLVLLGCVSHRVWCEGSCRGFAIDAAPATDV